MNNKQLKQFQIAVITQDILFLLKEGLQNKAGEHNEWLIHLTEYGDDTDSSLRDNVNLHSELFMLSMREIIDIYNDLLEKTNYSELYKLTCENNKMPYALNEKQHDVFVTNEKIIQKLKKKFDTFSENNFKKLAKLNEQIA